VNHSALVKTSDQPSFISANFSPFTSAEALRVANISLVPSLNLCCSIIVVLFYVLFVLHRSMYCLCVNVYYCHRMTTQLQLRNISYHIKAKSSWWNSKKKIMSSPYKIFVEATQKKKIKQATKSKTRRLSSNARIGPSKRKKRRVCSGPTPSDNPSDTDLAVSFAYDSTEEDEEQVADCRHCTGRFRKTIMENLLLFISVRQTQLSLH
jgi:hypothetical protein